MYVQYILDDACPDSISGERDDPMPGVGSADYFTRVFIKDTQHSVLNALRCGRRNSCTMIRRISIYTS